MDTHISDGMDKSWDHPWTTEEMRAKRREWSLAGDAGLLKHLQQFSENVMSRASKTEEALDSLTAQLNETAILIDNVTNTSLALANTQFIESRVQEDDVEIERKVEASMQESKDEDLAAADLITSVSESIKKGLNIMDEKYKKMEFVDSDSEEEEEDEEEEDNRLVLSVLLGPNNPYQDRPLPYVIGSERWKNSSKIGLESSSNSESEQVDDEEESKSDDADDDGVDLREFNMNTTPKSNIVEKLPSMSESEYSKRNDLTYMRNDNIDVVSENNVHSASESITANDNVPKVPLSNESAPNFAEELAKRLSTVRQAQKPVVIDEKSDAAINRFKDDLFTPEGDENATTDKSKTVFSGNKFLTDQSSENLWKDKPIKSYDNNIIPASIDIPPPISTVSTKPKSSIDDLFSDADSEDFDDIFSSKSTVKPIAKNKHPNVGNSVNTENARKTYLDIVVPAATSTPETNANTNNLFSDDEDVGDLFGTPKNQPPSKKKPAGEVPIPGNILNVDVENKLSNRVSRTQSTGSSGSDTSGNCEGNQEPLRGSSQNTVSNDNINDRNSTAANGSTYSSGISIQPPSINTESLSIGVDFQPQMTSTRLKSEEIYRERVLSDSLFTARSRNQANVNQNSNLTGNQPQEEQKEDDSSVQQDDVFENDHLFGPPPLPKADSKSAKSKELLLFDDSDSGDELFSTTSSGSRSQKSSDILTTVPQHQDKIKITQRGGLFDDEIDIFGRKDSPDVDIFGVVSKPTSKEESNLSTRKLPGISDSDGLFGSNTRDTAPNNNNVEKRQSVPPKEIRLFDDVEDIDDGDLFATKPIKTEAKPESRIFNDDDEGNLFSAKETFDAKPALGNVKQPVGTSESGTDTVDRDASTRKTKRKGSDILSGNGLFSSTVVSHGLVFEDDDYDDLFSDKGVTTGKRKGDEKSVPEIKVDTKVEGLSVKDPEAPVAPDIIVEDQGSSVSTSIKMDQGNEKDARRVTSQGIDTAGNAESEPKKIPPKSLDIQAAVSSSPPEESGQAARRTVSGKIKNLMGRMGDLKILSPMDTPPLWRRSEEKTDEEDSNADRDSDDGGCISTQGYSSPPSASEDSTTQKQSLQSTVSGESNVESAISFDEPAQVETLSIAASKTRVRIQAKRRPQSRHARKSALRHSGIDFDTVDAAGNHAQDEGHRGNQLSNTLGKEPTSSTNPNTLHIVAATSDRLVPSWTNDNLHRTGDANISLAVDDKSELGSISKESSMSANKNTLLSPSTDEEDLFDVPPDLPEDPQKEDTLFGRAPILSPVERVLEKPLASSRLLKDTHVRKPDSAEAAAEKGASGDKIGNDTNLQTEANNDSNTKAAASAASEEDNKRDSTESMDESKEMIDPLRDSSHDPLKDPSSLFAFVTKTPSPEKGKNLLFAEDDSLFSSGMRKSSEEQTMTKPGLNLFADDTEGDLFSVPLSKPVKKPLKDAKTILFDDDDQDDEDDSLFGSITKKSTVKPEPEKKNAAQQPGKKISLLDDGDDANLFFEQSEQSQQSDSGSIREQLNKSDAFASVTEAVKTSHITDILADQSSGEDDIFAVKSIPKKVVATKSLFPTDDDDDDDSGNIFGKKFSTSEPQMKSTETRASVKKSITRDLKKTAEKIGEDPLSILQDD